MVSSPQGWFLLRPFRHHSHTHTSTICDAWVHTKLFINRAYCSEEEPLKSVTEDNVKEWVDAAVSITHANSYVVGIGESKAWLVHP